MIILQSAGYVALLLLAYLAGSIHFGLIIGKAVYGIDIREHGSGNVGTTNVFRVLGKKAGIVVLLLDMLKGFVPALIAVLLYDPWPAIFIAAAPEVGHMFSIFLKGAGGKGVATGGGIALALIPGIFLIVLLVWIAMFLITRYVSLASLCAAALLPVMCFTLQEPTPYRIASILVAIIVFWAHRGNISRLLNHTEHRVTLPWMHGPDSGQGR